MQGEGSVLSLLNTVQPRSGRATMLGDSARSEKSPVQLDAPTEGTDARGGVKSFATEAWHQSTELVRTAGMFIFLPLTRCCLFPCSGVTYDSILPFQW